MPYVDRDRRPDLDEQDPPQSVGELTYCVTRLIDNYVIDQGKSYQTYAEILGALSATSHEVYRRQISPYEDEKCELNGDVFRS